MKDSSNNRLTVRVRKTPVFLSRKSQYRLSDFSYGEWTISENGEPKYYLNVFDELYSNLREQAKPDVERYLTQQFKKMGINLRFRPMIVGIPISSKSYVVELTLEKLPLEYAFV